MTKMQDLVTGLGCKRDMVLVYKFVVSSVAIWLVMQAVGQTLSAERQESWKQWLRQYRTVLKSEGQSNEQRMQQQNSANPCYIPRNHLLQKAIEKAEAHDFSEVQYVSSMLFASLHRLACQL